jgi:hypothetical protein
MTKHIALVFLMSVLTSFATGKTFGTPSPLDASKNVKSDINQLAPELEQLAYDIPDSWSTELRAIYINLGRDRGLLLQGTNLLCGGTGNCQIFVFRRVEEKWLSLFEDEAPICEAFTFGPGNTNGMKDLNIVANVGAEAAKTVRYKFDGHFYRRK